jgi:hypothetical protein
MQVPVSINNPHIYKFLASQGAFNIIGVKLKTSFVLRGVGVVAVGEKLNTLQEKYLGKSS